MPDYISQNPAGFVRLYKIIFLFQNLLTFDFLCGILIKSSGVSHLDELNCISRCGAAR